MFHQWREKCRAILESIIDHGVRSCDQLIMTAARARAAKTNVANADSDDIKLVGLLWPTVEDWHTKMNLLSVKSRL